MGLISIKGDEYELVKKLRVTKSKARSLFYQLALRSNKSDVGWEAEIRALLTQPFLCLNGEFLLIEVYEPFLMDMLRSKIRDLGFISVGAFSGSLEKVPIKSVSSLVNPYIPEGKKAEVFAMLRKQDDERDKLEDLIIGYLKKVRESAADKAGGRLSQKARERVTELLGMVKSRKQII